MSNTMSREQFEFISGIHDYMLSATNMNKHEAWDFAFIVCQFQEWLYDYLKERKTDETN